MTPAFRRRFASSVRTLPVIVALVLALAGVAVAVTLTTGRIGPSLRLTGNGHLLRPAGRMTQVGDFPTGSAVVPGGRFLWVADCGHGKDDIKVVDLAGRGRVVQTLPLPGCYGGVALAPRRAAGVCRRHPAGRIADLRPDEGQRRRRDPRLHRDPAQRPGHRAHPADAAGHERRKRAEQLAAAGVRGRQRAAGGASRSRRTAATSPSPSTAPTRQ